MNIFPLFNSETTLPPEVQFIPALLIGLAFGYTLERSGFGNARVLASQFYLYNMRVFKVMFGAIVTAAVGMSLLMAVGLLDFNALFFPETFIWPHLTGGLLLGAGFIISGYCPGTSIVAAASGNWDGLVTVIGVVLGSLVFGAVHPAIAEFTVSSALGVYLLPDLLGIGLPLVVLAVVLMAAGAFFGAEKLEKIMAGRAGKVKEASWNGNVVKLLGSFAATGIAAVAVFYALPPLPDTAGTPLPPTPITPIQLGQMIVDSPRQLYVVDMRAKPACAEEERRVPYALCLEDVEGDLANLNDGRTMIAYDQNGAEEPPPSLSRFPGPVLYLTGGLDAWRDQILAANPNPELLALLSQQEKNLLPALNSFFTGTKVQAPAKVFRPKVKRKKSGGGGGCG